MTARPRASRVPIHGSSQRSATRAASIAALALALLLPAVVPCGAEEAALVVRTDGDKVIVEGIQPGGEVVVMGVIRVVVGTIPGFQRWMGTSTDFDGDGSETITLDAEVRPERSVWVAVDVKDMDWAMSQPAVGGSPLAVPAETTLEAGATEWSVPTGKVEVLAVRPGGGIVSAPEIWTASVWDGGPHDVDGAHDGVVGVKAQKLVFLDGSLSSSPPTFEAGDLLVAIHPEVFYSFVARVVQGGGG